ncbi:MAG: NAD-dependent epimerase/dehydratase family protein [Planctomycetes bacterium]|nr:NAD-dependent epimerase/dehydratase family protein [Planctomycetota bacterium]
MSTANAGKALVTGGGGFLGRAIVAELLARGWQVTVLGRSAQPDLETRGVRVVQAEITDKDALRAGAKGADAVFHCAAKAGVWGVRAEYERINVEGTRAVIAAAQAERVPRLVHTSSPSVCFDGRDHVRAENDVPYPKRYLADYPRTKSIAERDVLFANARFGLWTVALRPHLIYGPGDPHLLPRLVERAKARKLVRVGDGRNEVTLTFVENAALAHVLAAETLGPAAPHAGRAYFVGDAEPVELWPWIERLLASLDLPRIERSLSRSSAFVLGGMCEAAWRLLRRTGEPPLTRFVAAQLATSHSYSMEPARRDFGYVPNVGPDAALERTRAWLAGRS